MNELAFVILRKNLQVFIEENKGLFVFLIIIKNHYFDKVNIL